MTTIPNKEISALKTEKISTSKIKAIVCGKYGSADGLQLQEIDKPIPKDNEVLVKVYASTVTPGDIFTRKLTFPMYFFIQPTARIIFGIKNLRKKVLGHEFSGKIESIGKDVKQFKKEDAVFGTTTGLKFGSHAEYICLPADGILIDKPKNMTYEEAAAAPVGGITALYILRKGKIQAGQKVLIYGASGSVGTFMVQIAKSFGAVVTAVCSTKNLELVKSLGADYVVDYTQEDFRKTGQTYDAIFDAVGKISNSNSKEALKETGIFLSVKSVTKGEKEDLVYLRELIEAGKIKSVIDRFYPLEQTAEAHRYVEKGHKRGNVVIRLTSN
jgi:NADPH:quinone reductase-like Zn-dependent oxidoreductase